MKSLVRSSNLELQHMRWGHRLLETAIARRVDKTARERERERARESERERERESEKCLG